MNAKITQGKRQLWQWDTGVQLMLFDIGTANEVHFATPDGVIRRDIVNNMCNIPDVVLQRAGTMVCYVFNREPYEGDTRHEFHFDVLPRPKPADYIDPPDEADYLDQLYDRLKDEIVGPPGPQGEQGQRGTGYLRILSKPADKVEMVDGKVVAHSLSLNIVKAEANVDEVRVGDCLLYNGAYVYPVVAVDVNVYTSKVVDLHGPEGPQGIEGERGEAGPAGPAGDPGEAGTSVSITSISQSTEDDGYSVVTFSDGKQLRVKNGSKGSPGEGGSGGSSDPEVVTVMCVPGDDFQSFTADKGFEDVHMALADGKLVQAYVHGLGAYASIVLFNDGMAMFGVTLAMEGDVIAVSLVMSADGTNILSALPIIGGPGEDEEETAKDTLVVTYEDHGNGSAMVTHSAEQVYAEYTAGRKVVLLIADGVLYHAEHISSDECRFVRYSFDADGGGTRSVAVLPNHGMVKFTHEAIPADRPNPHPLVINGVSYDGSKRVEMNVSAASSDAVVLTDTVTGKQYRLCVTNGKLTMEEVIES